MWATRIPNGASIGRRVPEILAPTCGKSENFRLNIAGTAAKMPVFSSDSYRGWKHLYSVSFSCVSEIKKFRPKIIFLIFKQIYIRTKMGAYVRLYVGNTCAKPRDDRTSRCRDIGSATFSVFTF